MLAGFVDRFRSHLGRKGWSCPYGASGDAGGPSLRQVQVWQQRAFKFQVPDNAPHGCASSQVIGPTAWLVVSHLNRVRSQKLSEQLPAPWCLRIP